MKASILAVTLLSAVALVFLGCGGLSEAQKRFESGLELQKQGQLEGAVQEYNEAIRLDPQLADAYNRRGGVYRQAGHLEQALQDYDEAIQIGSGQAGVYSGRGSTYLALDQAHRAIEDFGEAVRLDPQLAEAYYNRGLAYSDMAQGERAIEDYDQAIRLGPNRAEFYVTRADAYLHLNQPEKIIENLDEAIRLNPGVADDYVIRAGAYRALGKMEQAIEDYDEAITGAGRTKAWDKSIGPWRTLTWPLNSTSSYGIPIRSGVGLILSAASSSWLLLSLTRPSASGRPVRVPCRPTTTSGPRPTASWGSHSGRSRTWTRPSA